MIQARTKMMCLIGKPVHHSLSPALHNQLCKLNKFDGFYCAFAPEKDSLGDAVKGLKSLGGIGFNVTSPYKEAVIPFLDELHVDAKNLSAVNTVVIKENRLIGYNTDVLGVEELIKRNRLIVRGKRVAILGTGGASRAVALALTKLSVTEVDFYSRKPKATDFINRLSSRCQVDVLDYDAFASKQVGYDLIINATPIGMGKTINEQVVTINAVKDRGTFIDLIYSPWETKLLTCAKEKGYNIINGYDMLYYQGLKAYELWTGIYKDYYDDIKKLLINRSDEA